MDSVKEGHGTCQQPMSPRVPWCLWWSVFWKGKSTGGVWEPLEQTVFQPGEAVRGLSSRSKWVVIGIEISTTVAKLSKYSNGWCGGYSVAPHCRFVLSLTQRAKNPISPWNRVMFSENNSLIITFVPAWGRHHFRNQTALMTAGM